MTSPKAPLLSRMNTLKQADFEECLTDEQRGALEKIQTHREAEEPYINLHGPPYAGKTFLCWSLHDRGWAYYQALPNRVSETKVIYDHGAPERMATRRLRNNVELNGVACAVYVTEKPAEEVHPRVELSPSATHYETVASNWDQLGLDTDAAPTRSSGFTQTSSNHGDKHNERR